MYSFLPYKLREKAPSQEDVRRAKEEKIRDKGRDQEEALREKEEVHFI